MWRSGRRRHGRDAHATKIRRSWARCPCHQGRHGRAAGQDGPAAVGVSRRRWPARSWTPCSGSCRPIRSCASGWRSFRRCAERWPDCPRRPLRRSPARAGPGGRRGVLDDSDQHQREPYWWVEKLLAAAAVVLLAAGRFDLLRASSKLYIDQVALHQAKESKSPGEKSSDRPAFAKKTDQGGSARQVQPEGLQRLARMLGRTATRRWPP